jgi:hypothetical protein
VPSETIIGAMEGNLIFMDENLIFARQLIQRWCCMLRVMNGSLHLSF